MSPVRPNVGSPLPRKDGCSENFDIYKASGFKIELSRFSIKVGR